MPSSAVTLLSVLPHASALPWPPELFPLLTNFCSPLRALFGGPLLSQPVPLMLCYRAPEVAPGAGYTGPVEPDAWVHPCSAAD